MISWNLCKKLFDGFTILRWTDFLRPVEFVQMEKSAMQAILSYIIGKEYEERSHKKLDWLYIIESCIYGLLCKIATSDIKSTVNNQIKKNNLDDLKKFIVGVYFDNDYGAKEGYEAINKQKLEKYIIESNKKSDNAEFHICYFAHKFATYREFCYIKPYNLLSPDIKNVEADINPRTISENMKDNILRNITNNMSDGEDNLLSFYAYFEKLKPQIRWSQTCRLPETTVLGHSMYVAVLTYFAIKCLEIKNNETEVLVNSFFAALFHDLPESLTRDIISPVKKSIDNLDALLSKYEYDQVVNKLLGKIERCKWKEDFLYLLGKTNDCKFDTFADRKFVLGELIKAVDTTAAFMEAKMSIELGVDSEELQKGIRNCSKGIIKKSFDYTRLSKADWRVSEKIINFSDFLATIPQYSIGIIKE